MWKKLDWILIAAVSGIVGASCIASAYMLFLAARPTKHALPEPIPPSQASSYSDPIGANVDNAPAQDDVVPQNGASQDFIPDLPAPPTPRVPFVDHRYDGVITPDEILRIKDSLRLSPDQETAWRPLAAAFREARTQQKARIDAGQRLTSAFNEQVVATLIPSAFPLVQSLRDEQLKNAGMLSRALGFKSVSAMTEAAKASTEPVVKKPPPEPRVAVTPALPPVAKTPSLIDHRYDGLLTAAEINRIKLSLKLRPDQEPYWPPVAAILRELGQQQMAQVDAGQKLDLAMSGGEAQRFYFAASPLLQTLTEEQKSEVRRRARMMGLEAYASYL